MGFGRTGRTLKMKWAKSDSLFVITWGRSWTRENQPETSRSYKSATGYHGESVGQWDTSVKEALALTQENQEVLQSKANQGRSTLTPEQVYIRRTGGIRGVQSIGVFDEANKITIRPAAARHGPRNNAGHSPETSPRHRPGHWWVASSSSKLMNWCLGEHGDFKMFATIGKRFILTRIILLRYWRKERHINIYIYL